MEPTYKHGELVFISHSRNYGLKDVVIAFMNGKEVIKRITKINNGQIYLEGDNKEKSSNGWVVDRHIMGKVVWPKKNN